MPLQSTNFVSFFQGACAESHIAALFQFAGFEVTKVAPDAGIDLIVTNVARSRFLDDPAKSINVQVKSTILDSTGAQFWIDESELEYLCKGDMRFTVFALFHNLAIKLDTDSFNIYADQVEKMLERDMANYIESLVELSGRQRFRDGHENIFDFSRYSLTLFWLNSQQMERAKNDGLWKHNPRLGKYSLHVSLRDTVVTAGGSVLMAELQEVRYMMLKCRSQRNFDEGKFSHDHM